MFYVYIHKRADDGQVFYVGKGNGYRAWSKSRNKWWHRVVKKYGHTVEIVKEYPTEQEAHAAEIELIAFYRLSGALLVNLTDGGEGCIGRVVSAEVRAKLKASNDISKKPELRERLKALARINQNKPDVKEKIRKATIARWKDPEARQRMIDANRLSLSPERNKKISDGLRLSHADPIVKARRCAALKVAKNTPQAKAQQSALMRKSKSRPFVCVEEIKQFEALIDAAEWLKFKGRPKAAISCISRALSGHIPTAYGYHWRRLNLEY